MNRFRATTLLLTLCATLACAGRAGAQAAPSVTDAIQHDPVLRAMSLELQRSREQLQLENMQRPYYIEYSILDFEVKSAEFVYGAARSDQTQHLRLVRSVVRIGDYKQDSYFGSGQGSLEVVPVDDDVTAIRHQIWLTTDTAYKQAIQALTQKQALLKQFEGDSGVEDFSHEPPAQAISPTNRNPVDPQPWREALKSATALYRMDPELQSLEAQLVFRTQTRYYMNSEGSVLRQPDDSYVLAVAGSSQAPDGMRLDQSQSWVMADAKELPTPDQIRTGVSKIIDTLAALRKAPMVEDEYHGPVLFTAEAANSLFHTLVGNAVLGRKPRPGQTSRTVGDYAGSYKSRVLPDFLTLVDDPTVRTFGGRTLIGSYTYDDEGVKAQTVPVIEKGELHNYLMGRQPIRDFPTSNGHGRGAGITPPSPSLGNLFVRVSQPMTFDALQQKMIQMCKDQDQPYGYLVRSLGRGFAPQVLVRIYASDGHAELVRGAEFQQLDSRALRSDLLAAGDDFKVDNNMDAVPNSVIGPSVLFGDLQIKRSSQAKDKLPDYPPPDSKATATPAVKAGK